MIKIEQQPNKFAALRKELKLFKDNGQQEYFTDPAKRRLRSYIVQGINGGITALNPPAVDGVSETLYSTDGFTQLLFDLKNYPILPAQKQTELAWDVFRAREAAEQLNSGDLPPDEANRLEGIKARGNEAKKAVVQSNLRMIINIALRYKNPDLDLPDLISEGTIGALRAMDNFDPRKGFKVTTYMYWVAKTYIRNAVKEQSRLIKISRSPQETQSQVMRRYDELVQKLGFFPTDDEAAARLGMTAEKISFYKNMLNHSITSFNSPAGEGERTIEEVTPNCDPDKDPQEMAERQMVRETIEDAVNMIGNEKIREAVRLRIGLGDPDGIGLSYERIGEILGQSKQRNKQRADKGIQVLRNDEELMELYRLS